MNAVKLFFSYFILLNLVSCDFLGLESTRDYFPINIGNSWTFSFWFKPISWDDEKYEGELIWEIVNIGKGNSRTIELLETINGKRTTYNYNTNKNETTTVNRQNIINLLLNLIILK